MLIDGASMGIPQAGDHMAQAHGLFGFAGITRP